MKEPTYRQALSHGWEIAKKYKLLWLFGFFATFLGQMGLLDFVVNVFLAMDSQNLGYSLFLDFPALTRTLALGLGEIGLGISGWAWFVWLAVFFLGVKILFIFISVTSQAALVHGIGQSMGRSKKVNTSKAWHAGTGHFWRVFFINVARRIAIIAMALVVGFAAYQVALSATALSTVLFAILMVLGLFIGMMLSFLLVYAIGYVVIEEQSFGEAIVSAWHLFDKHPLVSLEVGAIMLLANVVAGAIALLAVAIFLGFMALVWVITLMTGISLLWMVGFFIGMALLVLFLALLGTMLTVYTTSVWTYLFVKMHKKGVKSRILHALAVAK